MSNRQEMMSKCMFQPTVFPFISESYFLSLTLALSLSLLPKISFPQRGQVGFALDVVRHPLTFQQSITTISQSSILQQGHL